MRSAPFVRWTPVRANEHAANEPKHYLLEWQYEAPVGVGGEPRSVWGGTVPGISEGPASLLASEHAPGVALLHFGASHKSMIALEPKDSHQMPVAPHTAAASRAQWSISSTGVITNDELIAIRIPSREPARAVVSDKVLVLGTPQATRAEALSPTGDVIAAADLDNGVCVLTLPFGGASHIRVTDQIRNPLATTVFADGSQGPRVFGDQLVTSWS